MTHLTDTWLPKPVTICDFTWYGPGETFFPLLTYIVNGISYPPTGTGHDYLFQVYTAPLNTAITFDSTLAPTYPGIVTPSGVEILSYIWNLGNGTTAYGPKATVTYSYPSPVPDLAVTLTITDSLGREYATTHPLALTVGLFTSGNIQVRQGTARSYP